MGSSRPFLCLFALRPKLTQRTDRRFAFQAYVSNQEWDISGLQDCEQGVGCPVSKTFTDQQFAVPMGCSNIGIQAHKNLGRGTVQTFGPTPGNANRGEIEISDEGFGGADVYDITVTLTCLSGGALSTPTRPVRLSCTHNTQTGAAGLGCHMGRVEVYNSRALHSDGRTRGTWGASPDNKCCLLLSLIVAQF